MVLTKSLSSAISKPTHKAHTKMATEVQPANPPSEVPLADSNIARRCPKRSLAELEHLSGNPTKNSASLTIQID